MANRIIYWGGSSWVELDSADADTLDSLNSTYFLNPSNLSSNVPVAKLGTGTANTNVFLRGDGSWQTPPLPAGLSSGSASSGYITYNGTTSTAGQWNGGTTTPTATTRQNYNGYLYATKVYGSVYNDYAEYRKSDCKHIGGTVVTECGDGKVAQSKQRLCKIPMVVSDTWGFIIGEVEDSVPIAVAGRVLVYTDKDRKTFKTGDAVCSGINGTVSKMKWWEKIIFPDRLLGLVSEVPSYEVWGNDDTKVSNRIWIKI